MSKDVHVVLGRDVTLEKFLTYIQDHSDFSVKNIPSQDPGSAKKHKKMEWMLNYGQIEFTLNQAPVALHYSILEEDLVRDNYPEASNTIPVNGQHLIILMDCEKVPAPFIRALCDDLGGSLEKDESLACCASFDVLGG